MSFSLDNNTTLRAFLCKLQSDTRHLALLAAEHNSHSGCRVPISGPNEESARLYSTVVDDLRIILPELSLVHYSRLATSQYPWGDSDYAKSDNDPTRYTFGQLKKMADKARRKHPNLLFLRSWDLEKKKPVTAGDS